MKEQILDFIDKVKNLKVLVAGETIIDEFIEVSYEGQSMKSICPVYKLTDSKTCQIGGAGAIVNHLKEFVGAVDFVTNEDSEIVKTRYVDYDDKKKHIEVNKFDTKNFKPLNIDSKKYDVVIIADFGHGFCDNTNIDEGFHLMCQTNSNNFGFNRMSKWKHIRKRSVCLDLREASLQMNKKNKYNSSDEVKEIYNYEMNAEYLFLTKGRAGAIFTDGNEVHSQEVFRSEIVDTIGAGDTFFAFAALASQIDIDNKEKLLVPSIAASLSTTWLCNAESVTPEKLIQHAGRYI